MRCAPRLGNACRYEQKMRHLAGRNQRRNHAGRVYPKPAPDAKSSGVGLSASVRDEPRPIRSVPRLATNAYFVRFLRGAPSETPSFEAC
jgi:hypothetical protein